MKYLFKNNKAPENPILFIHGYYGDATNMVQFRSNITTNDYYAVYLPLHNSNKDIKLKESDLRFFAKLIVNWIIKKDLKNITLMGHSMGGGVSLILLSLIPERFKNIVLICPLTPNCSMFQSRTIKKRAQILFKNQIPNFFKETKKTFQKNSEIQKNSELAEKKQKHSLNLLNLLLTKSEIENIYLISNVYFQGLKEKKKRLSDFFTQIEDGMLVTFKKKNLLFTCFSKKAKKDMEIGIQNAYKMNIPVLYIYGSEEDFLTPKDLTKEFLINHNPNIKLSCIKNTAHLPFIGNYKDFEKDLLTFLELPLNQKKKVD